MKQTTSEIISELGNMKRTETKTRTVDPETEEWLYRLKNRKKYNTAPKPVDVTTLKYDLEPKKELTYDVIANAVFTEMAKRLHRIGKKEVKMLQVNIETMRKMINSFLQPHSKGLYLFGNNSSGKTFALKSLIKGFNNLHYSGRYNGTYTIDLIEYKGIAKMIEDSGSRDAIYNIREEILIDDLGYLGESKQNNFGTKIDLVDEIVFHTNRLYVSMGKRFFFTSNMSIDQVLNRYGKATRDRLIECCDPYYWEIDGGGYRD